MAINDGTRSGWRHDSSPEAAGTVLGLDGERIGLHPPQRQIHGGTDARRIDYRDLVGEIVHARVETGHFAAFGIDVGDMRIRQRAIAGRRIRAKTGDRAVGQVPVGLADHHERVVELVGIRVLDAAFDD